MKIVVVLSFVLSILFSNESNIDKIAKPGYCYSVLTDAGFYTPVSENYFQDIYTKDRCELFDKPPLFADKKAYIGCYKKESSANRYFKNSTFNFKNAKVVYHRVYDGIPYVIFPNNSSVNLNRALRLSLIHI